MTIRQTVSRLGLHESPGRKTSKPNEQMEGPVARTIENQTAKLPSDLFLWAAGAVALTTLLFRYTGRKERAIYFGGWVPAILILGLYNKLVKVGGSDRMTA